MPNVVMSGFFFSVCIVDAIEFNFGRNATVTCQTEILLFGHL
jgi:hypothetical protein